MSFAKFGGWIRIIWVLVWLAFTLSFAFWWFALNTKHIQLLAELQPDRADHWARQERMILWEGSAWIILLALGGGALVLLVQNEKIRVRRIREFFASFSHEVKTSLASLRLQAEALKDDGFTTSPVLDRLIGDTVRLQVQLENSLFFASETNLQLFVEPITMSQLVERMREQWPNLEIALNKEAVVRGDERALRTIFGNLLQNAVVHGKASKVSIDVIVSGGRVHVSVRDNGQGFKGDKAQLGRLFHRPTPASGSGLGLYITRLLVLRMGGQYSDEYKNGDGFRVSFELPGEPA